MGLLTALERRMLRSGALFGQRGTDSSLAARMQRTLANGYPDSGDAETALLSAWKRLGLAGKPPVSADNIAPRKIRLADLPDEEAAGWVQREKRDYYAGVLAEGEPPPILIARDYSTGRWDVLDGNHRIAALRQAGRRDIHARDVTPLFGRYRSMD